MQVLVARDLRAPGVRSCESRAPVDDVRQLVHFLQALAGRSQICRGVLIQEARQIESYWRVAHNLPPLSASPLGMLLESCGPGPT